MRAAWALPLLLLAPVLAGCGAPATGPGPGPGPGGAVADLAFPVLSVQVTPDELEPQRGDLLVAWGQGAFAVSAPGEKGMMARTVVSGGVAYWTNQDLGWTREGLAEGVGGGRLSERLVLWDLKALAAHPALSVEVANEGRWTNLTGAGTVRVGPHEYPIMLYVSARDGTVVAGRVESEAGHESPYAFHPATYDFPFPPAPPASSLPLGAVVQGDARASEGHATLMQLVSDYARNHGGTLPESVDPQTLRVELLASGKEWPGNPYSGQGMAARRASGDFLWVRCALSDGRFTGLGYDGPLVRQGYGASCR